MHTQARAYKEGAFTPLQSLFFWCEDQLCQQGLLLRDAPQSCQWRGGDIPRSWTSRCLNVRPARTHTHNTYSLYPLTIV